MDKFQQFHQQLQENPHVPIPKNCNPNNPRGICSGLVQPIDFVQYGVVWWSRDLYLGLLPSNQPAKLDHLEVSWVMVPQNHPFWWNCQIINNPVCGVPLEYRKPPCLEPLQYSLSPTKHQKKFARFCLQSLGHIGLPGPVRTRRDQTQLFVHFGEVWPRASQFFGE